MTGILNLLAGALGRIPSDDYFEYTTLLLPGNGTNGAQNNTFLDGSTNNFTITRNGNTTQGTFSPFSQTGWGNYFDGSGDYLSVPSNTAFNLAGGNFTVEAWVFMSAGSGAKRTIISRHNSGVDATWDFYVDTDNKAYFEVWSASLSPDRIATDSTIPLNQWVHIASGINGSNLFVCVDGVYKSKALTITPQTSSGIIVRVGMNSNGSSFPYTGYISNARIVKGVAVYTGNFTPPTSPLAATQSAGTNISAITTGQTSLLTCQSNRFIDNGQGNTSNTPFTITVNGNTSVVAFSPFNPTASWSAATYGGSGYFDGSGDYLSVASTSALGYGTGDFTIEFWYYPTSLAVDKQLWDQRVAGSDTLPDIYVSSTGALKYFTAGAERISGGTVTVNQWQHIALSKASGTTRLFLNGSQVGSNYTDSNNYGTSSALRLGTGWNVGDFVTGYIADARALKGTGYSTITVPTAPLTAITNTSLLLNFTNAGIYDATSKNDLETVGNAQISTTQSKWGGSSISFDGTGDWLLSTPNVTNDFGTGNFTIEAWIYMTSTSNYFYIYNSSNANFNSPNFTFLYDTSLGLRMYAHGGTYTVNQGSTSGWAANTWYYVALVRNGGTITIYRNGTSLASGSTFSGVSFGSATAFLQIGGSSPDSRSNNGYIQDLRVSRYARDVTTTPTAAFPTL